MKKRFKKILCVLLVAVMCLVSAPLQNFVGFEWGLFDFVTKVSAATEYAEGYYTYTVLNGEATITGVDTSISGDVTIPATLGGYPVTTIDFWSGGNEGHNLVYQHITSITISDGIKKLYLCTFENCPNLKKLVIPESVNDIYEGSFNNCPNLTDITVIGDSIISFDESMFWHYLQNNASKTHGAYVGKHLLQAEFADIDQQLIVKDGTISIGIFAITAGEGDEKSISIVIPNSIRYIDYYAVHLPYGGSISDIYYKGTEEQWNEIDIDESNDGWISNATIHYSYHTHNYTASITEPTCALQGYTTYTCSCGDSFVDDYVNSTGEHDWYTDDYLQFAPCAGGTQFYYCRNCDASKGEEVEPTDHEWLVYDDSDLFAPCKGGTICYRCFYCGEEKFEVVEGTDEHSWYENGAWVPSCLGGTKSYCCEYCGATKTEEIEGTGEHNWYETSCDEFHYCIGGTIEYSCEACGTTKSEYIEGTGEHDWMCWDGDYDYLYCEGGEVKFICDDCNEVMVEYIEAEGHIFTYVSNEDATCTEDGTKYEYCYRCDTEGETVTDEGTATGHNYTEAKVLAKQTCTQDGVSVHICKNCFDISVINESAYDHYDNDGDSKCDECSVVLDVSGTVIPDEPTTPDSPAEPEQPKKEANIFSLLTEFLNNIIDFFRQLFGID